MKKRMISLLMALAMSLTLLPTTSYAAEESGTAIGAGRLCEHHTAHDDACGYVEGIEESPCTHEHGAECYTEVTSCIHEHTQDCYPVSDSSDASGVMASDAGNDEDTMPSDTQSDEEAMPSDTKADEGAATSGNEPGESAASSEAVEPSECSHVCSVESGCIKQELDCHHEHNEECGYAPAVEGQPCTYVCTLCGMTEITAWSWVDAQDAIDPDSGVLTLSASAESPVPYEDIVALLPVEIEATTEDGTETLSLDSWSCDDYPAEGAYTGSYAFRAVLPEGYGLAADAPALTVTVELDDEVMLMAAGTTHANHPICGASCKHDTKHYNDNYNNWLASDYGTDAKSLVLLVGGPNSTYGETLKTSGSEWVLPEGTYYLKDDIHIDKTIRIDENVTICLNGHDIYIDKDVAAFRIIKKNQASKSCKLKLTNCKERCGEIKSNNTDNRGNGVNIIDGTFDMYGGKIRGCRRGVFVDSSCTFNMYGGEISENEANGVTLNNNSNAIFNMYGGEISRNTEYGVEIMKGPTFNMYGGVIKDNPSKIEHIGVWCQGGTFNMSGGEISSCTRGVHVTCTDDSFRSGVGNFEMSGGTITGNKIGVSLFTRYNSKEYSTNNITKSSKFTMTGGEIKNNTDIGVDMGYNKQQNFHAGGELTVGGTARIQDNSNKNAYSYGNVYFRYGEIKLASSPAFTKGAYIGITTPDKTLPTAGNPLLIVGNVSSQDEVADYFHSDRDGYVIKCADAGSSHTTHTLNLTVSPHTHSWVYTKESESTVSVACNGTGTCAYQTTPATVSISTDKTKYDVETITEAPKAVLTYSNWPDGLAKFQESAIEYYKSADGGSTYTVLVTDNNDLKKPGKYVAQLDFVKGSKYLVTYFSVVDNRKQEPKYTPPTANPGLTYNGRELILINQGHTEGGIMQYRLDSGTYSATLPTATNAGTYTVYYKVVGDASHNDTAEQSITVTIGKAPLTGTPTFTPVTEAGKTIADVTLTAPTEWPAGTFYWMNGEIGLDGATLITQGTPYHWVFIPTDSGNYQSIGGSIVLWAKGSDAPGQGGGTSGGDNSNTGDSNSSDTGAGNGTSSGNTTGTTPAVVVTVPVSGSEKSIQVNARISGTTANIENVDLSKLETVIGDDVKTGVVTISFFGLNKKVDTVKLPANVVKQIAEAVNDPDNDAESLEIVLSDGSSIEFDAKTLGDKIAQVDGVDITISIRYIDAGTMNSLQQQAVGSRPALEIIVTSGGRPISDMGGRITMYAPYELGLGEQAGGVVVYYVDGNGSRQLCETSYDPIKKQVSWVTTHLSIYMIGYDESRVNPAGNPQENQTAGDSNASCVAYIVQKGNTLWAIAKKHGCTISEIVAANSDLIKNPNRIYAGWQLKIPQD